MSWILGRSGGVVELARLSSVSVYHFARREKYV